MKTSVSDLLAGDFCVMPQFIVCGIEYVISLMISSPIANSIRPTFELAFVGHGVFVSLIFTFLIISYYFHLAL